LAQFAALAKRLADMGEPFVFGLPDDDREGFITRRGLTILSDRRMPEHHKVVLLVTQT
jgi:hypothetical protein